MLLVDIKDQVALVTLDLYGAEPGAPGHMFRFPTLTANTTRKPGIR